MASLFLLSVLIVIVLVGFWLQNRKLTELEKLFNELGDHVGAYIDAMEDKSK